MARNRNSPPISLSELRKFHYSISKADPRFAQATDEQRDALNSVPDSELDSLITYCERHDLALTPLSADALLLPTADQVGQYRIYCTTDALCKIARGTNLYRPGGEALTYVDSGLCVTARGYYRDGQTNDRWYEISAFATQRAYERKSLSQTDIWTPVGIWAVAPELELRRIARALCALSALPKSLEEHHVLGVDPEILVRMDEAIFAEK